MTTQTEVSWEQMRDRSLSGLLFLHARRDAEEEARQIVRDGLRAAGMMPRAEFLAPRADPSGRRLRAGQWSYVMASPGGRGQYRNTAGDLPGEDGLS